jgi:hypothetical protein
LFVPFGLPQSEEPLGFTALPQLELRTAKMRFDAPSTLHRFYVLLVGGKRDGVL